MHYVPMSIMYQFFTRGNIVLFLYRFAISLTPAPRVIPQSDAPGARPVTWRGTAGPLGPLQKLSGRVPSKTT